MQPSVAPEQLDARTRRDVTALAHRVEAEDGAPPLSDQAVTRLGAADVTHLIARDGDEAAGEVAGYAQLDGESLEIAAATAAVAPLLETALARANRPLLVWSHGRRSRLVTTLETHGFERVRELHQLRRALVASTLPADPPLPDGVTVRAFVPGADDAAWLELNAAAFAQHAEQGRWTADDLHARMTEPWFDAAGFLLAERAGTLLGFHWTKVHPDGDGEVYVLGVSPQAQGLGLGGALLVRGLRHLAERGCPAVLLYVDGDNPTAMHLYERDGFARHDLDVQWRSS